MAVREAVLAGAQTTLRCAAGPATEAVVSWNAPAAEAVDLRVRSAGGRMTRWLRLAALGARRRSFSERDGDVAIEIDTIRSRQPFEAVDVRLVSSECRRPHDTAVVYLATPTPRSRC
jgi:hypothetical protein